MNLVIINNNMFEHNIDIAKMFKFIINNRYNKLITYNHYLSNFNQISDINMFNMKQDIFNITSVLYNIDINKIYDNDYINNNYINMNTGKIININDNNDLKETNKYTVFINKYTEDNILNYLHSRIYLDKNIYVSILVLIYLVEKTIKSNIIYNENISLSKYKNINRNNINIFYNITDTKETNIFKSDKHLFVKINNSKEKISNKVNIRPDYIIEYNHDKEELFNYLKEFIQKYL